MNLMNNSDNDHQLPGQDPTQEKKADNDQQVKIEQGISQNRHRSSVYRFYVGSHNL